MPASHIREYPRSTAEDQEEVLYLAIKQYTPLDAKFEDEGDVTIIGAHANGFPKVALLPHEDRIRTDPSRNYMNLFGTTCTTD